MSRAELDRALAALGAGAALIVVAIVGGIIATGASQDFFQVARPIEDHLARLTGQPALGLRLNIGLDNLFIAFYVAYFAALAARFRPLMGPWMTGIALGAMLLAALIDVTENNHIIMMLHSAERGLPLAGAESQLQMIASNVKFQASYVALFLFAFGFRKEGALGQAIAWLFRVYVLVGIVSLVIAPELARPFALGRTLFFVAGFVLSALMFHRSARAAGRG